MRYKIHSFTLPEVLISIAIASFIGIVINQVWLYINKRGIFLEEKTSRLLFSYKAITKLGDLLENVSEVTRCKSNFISFKLKPPVASIAEEETMTVEFSKSKIQISKAGRTNFIHLPDSVEIKFIPYYFSNGKVLIHDKELDDSVTRSKIFMFEFQVFYKDNLLFSLHKTIPSQAEKILAGELK